jgi:predicted ATP-binding protein involved in virulence
MYIEKIKIDKFRVLEDIEIHFQPPGGATADPETGNVVNVIAGVNGSGKTSLLNAIYDCLSDSYDFTAIKKYGDVIIKGVSLRSNDDIDYNWRFNYNYKNEMHEHVGFDNIFSFPWVIFMPAQLNFQYNAMPSVSTEYTYLKKIEGNVLGNAEAYVKEFIFNIERQSRIADPKERARKSIEAFNKVFVDTEFLTKLVDLDGTRFNRPIFESVTGKHVTIDQLSDGEKQLYGRVIALMMLQPDDSVILVDEPEIALHPAWQQKIMQIYSRIGKNNQFIVATHSPQIIASVPYKNRILLRKENGKIQPVHMNQPPSGVYHRQLKIRF